jgi:hypothetical protein
MGTTEKTLRVVEFVQDGLYREKKIHVQQEIDANGMLLREIGRTETLGDVFREAQEGEAATESIIDAGTFEMRSLVKVAAIPVQAPAPVSVETGPPRLEERPAEEKPEITALAAAALKKVTKAATVAEAVKASSAPLKPLKKTVRRAPKDEVAQARQRKMAKMNAQQRAQAKKRKAPTTGQSGPEIELDVEDLNRKERKVVEFLADATKAKTLAEMASACFPHEPKARRNSWVRNSLRRLVCAGLVDRVTAGCYRATAIAKRRVHKLAKAA